MKRIPAILAITLALAIAWSCSDRPAGEQPPASPDRVVDLEHRFAAAVAERGMRQGFLEFAASDGVLFRPKAVSAREFLEALADRPGLLSWYPVLAAQAASGELGYTTGPWSFRAAPEAQPVGFGHYVTVWHRTADGRWGFAIDHGISHAEPSQTEAALVAESQAADADEDSGAAQPGAAATVLEALRVRDDAYSAALAADAERALREFAHETVRLYREEHFPATGRAAAASLLAGLPRVGRGTTAFADAAASADLGYTYGYLQDANEPGRDGYVYLRLWQRTAGDWMVSLDVTTPIPPATSAGGGQ